MKWRYRRVHKGKFERGIATQQQRERRLLQMGEAAPKNTSVSSLKRKDNCLDDVRQDQDKSSTSDNDEALPPIQLQEHHYISQSVRHKIWLSTWLGKNQDDPTLKVRMYYSHITSSELLPRTFSLVSRSTCSADYLGMITMATNTRSLCRNEVDSHSYTIRYTSTVEFA